MQLAAFAKHHVFADDTKRADDAIRADIGARMNDRGGMNGCHVGSTSMKVTSASLTSSPSTLQTPLALPILPRNLVNSTSITSVSPGRTGLRHFTLSAAMK